jgi:hypothetical protein
MALPFGNYTFSIYLYEAFSFTINKPVGSATLTTSNSPGLPASYFDTSTSRVIFSSTSNAAAVGNQPFTITARDASSSIIGVSSNNVVVGTGRFRDSTNNNVSGSNFTYYKNEPITPVEFRAPFVISTPTVVPTLPPGLSFVDISGGGWYSLTGTPVVTVPQSNYLVIGRGTGTNTGKIVTSSNIGIVISNERLLLNVSGSTIVSPMIVGTAITDRVVTARFPPYSNGGKSMSYVWSGLPDGIVVKDSLGVIKTSPFIPADASYTLVLSGTPTSNAAESFRLAGISSKTVSILATRTNPLPAISNATAFTFGFDETVLFTGSNIDRLYTNNPLNPTANYFDARTAFGSTSNVTDIFSPDLRSDLSINFVPSENRGYLTGTPTTASSNTYTIRATNSNGYTRDLLQPIVVVNDTITFTSPLDTCYNFVLSRPLSNALTGYYPANIQFLASAASGNALAFTTSDLTGTGLSLDASGVTNGVRLVGTPTVVVAEQTLRVTATASNTGAVAYKDVLFEILDDTITLSNIPASNLAFVQNRSIVPVQLRGTALSGRPVSTFRGTMPIGLSLGATGLITGAPLGSVGGSFSFTAGTDFVTQPFTLSYTITPDTMIFPLVPSVYTYAAGSPVSINVDALAYSGKTASNYSFSGLTPTYGLTIGSNTGVIGGTISSGVPPDALLPATSNFAVNTNAGLLDGSLSVTMTTANRPFQRFYAVQYLDFRAGVWESGWYYANSAGELGTLETPGIYFPVFLADFTIRYAALLDATLVYTITGLGEAQGSIVRSFNDLPNETRSFGGTEGATSNMRPYKAISVSNTTSWYIGGTVTGSNGKTYVSLFQSTDDAVTFSNVTPGGIGVEPRRSPLGSPSNRFTNYYTAYGTAFGYSNGVFLLGGTYDASLGPSSSRMKRSTDGTTWIDVVGMFEAEVGNISTDGPVWVATGSSLYETGVSNTVVGPADTLKYSTDQGQTWINAGGTPHDVLGFEVAYASNVWLSSGISRTGGNVTSTLVFSMDGISWAPVNLSGTFNTSETTPRLSEVASVFFDTTYNLWYVFAKFDATPPALAQSFVYTHLPIGDMSTDWNIVATDVFPFNFWPGQIYPSRLLGQRLTAEGPTTVTLSFATASGTGPTFTSPSSSAFTLYQYVNNDPITVSATGTGTVYFFVVAAELPTGISFDPVTGVFSGMSVNVGTRVVNIYAKDDNGITVFAITFTTIQAFVVKKQSGAGAWTALVRQAATVGGAQNSVNGRVVPAQQVALGEFTRDEPLDSVTASNCPC